MFTTLTINNQEFQLSLPMKQAIMLEEKLGANPLQIIGNWDENHFPTYHQLSCFLWAMLQKYQHGITMDNAFDMLEDYKNDGHNVFDLVGVIIDVMQKDGYISEESNEESEKN